PCSSRWPLARGPSALGPSPGWAFARGACARWPAPPAPPPARAAGSGLGSSPAGPGALPLSPRPHRGPRRVSPGRRQGIPAITVVLDEAWRRPATTANLGRHGAAHRDDRRVEPSVISAIPVQLADSGLATDIADGLVGVEKVLAEAANAEEPLLTEASRHLIDAGGKRFRATLVLLAAHFGDSRDARIVPAAAAIELTHLATLYHDDVMDEA